MEANVAISGNEKTIDAYVAGLSKLYGQELAAQAAGLLNDYSGNKEAVKGFIEAMDRYLVDTKFINKVDDPKANLIDAVNGIRACGATRQMFDLVGSMQSDASTSRKIARNIMRYTLYKTGESADTAASANTGLLEKAEYAARFCNATMLVYNEIGTVYHFLLAGTGKSPPQSRIVLSSQRPCGDLASGDLGECQSRVNGAGFDIRIEVDQSDYELRSTLCHEVYHSLQDDRTSRLLHPEVQNYLVEGGSVFAESAFDEMGAAAGGMARAVVGKLMERISHYDEARRVEDAMPFLGRVFDAMAGADTLRHASKALREIRLNRPESEMGTYRPYSVGPGLALLVFAYNDFDVEKTLKDMLKPYDEIMEWLYDSIKADRDREALKRIGAAFIGGAIRG